MSETEQTQLTVPDALRLGMRHHQSGNLQQAEFIYHKVLGAEPNNSEALHLLGLIHFQRNNPERALGLIQRAISINSTAAPYYSNLGLIFQSLGNFDIAMLNFRRAIALSPGYAEAHNNLGTALYATGKYAEAETTYREAIRLKQAYPEAHYNLGIVLKALGRVDEAIASYQEAIRLRPNYAEAHNNLGFVYQEQEKHDEAEGHYDKAIAANPRYAEAHNNIGAVYLSQGKTDEAIASYRKALELKPRYAEAYNNLGYALADKRKFDEAIEAYHKALALKPDYADAHNNLGLSLKDSGRLEEALLCFDRAIRLQPDFTKAVNNKGIVYQQMGRFDEAIEAFRKAISLEKHIASAYRNLVNCRKFTEADLPLLDEIEGYLAEADLKDEDESDIHFALGKINDDLGRAEKAFGHYSKANDYERTKYTFDHAEHSAMIDAMIATYTKEFFAERAGFGSDSRLPILVLGMMRSGTTLVEQTISSHPLVFGAGELDFWGEQGKTRPTESVPPMTRDDVRQLADDYIAYLRKHSADAQHITDKMPNNYLKIGMIHLAFPQAKIIHCKRDLVDICLSIYFHKFGGYHPYAYDLDHLAFYAREYVRLMEHWRSVLPADVFLDLQYEDLVADFEPVARRMMEFCGLAWDEQCLRFYEQERPIKTASCWQVRQPLYSSSVERWRRYEPFLGPLAGLVKSS